MTTTKRIDTTDGSRRDFIKGVAAVGGSILVAWNGGGLARAYASRGQTDLRSPSVADEPPMAADELVAAINDDLAAIDSQIRNHKYLSALHRKRVSPEALKAFPGHEYHTVLSDLRSLAYMVQRFGHDPLAGPFLNGVLQGEFAGLPAIVRMAEKLDMSEEALANYQVTPEGFTYPTYMAWQAAYGSAAAVTCGLLVNFAAWGHNCGEMSKALQANYGFSSEETAFLDGFATLPPFDDAALPIIQAGLDAGVSAAEIHAAARLFQAYEKMFWDAMASLANVK